MRIDFDASDVRTLAVDLGGAPRRVRRAALGVLRDGSRSVERLLRVDASGHRYLADLPSSVSSGQVGPMHFEIGFDKGGQGSLAHIIVDGSVNNAPVFSNTASLRKALPGITRDMAAAGERSLFGGMR